MIWLRALSVIVGAVLLMGAAHVVITHTGGYQGGENFLPMLMAIGGGVGSIGAVVAWDNGKRGLAAAVFVCIAFAEVQGFIATAERLLAQREGAQAPLIAATKAFRTAAERVKAAERAVLSPPATTPRLTAAIAAKAAADAAVVSKSAEMGCRNNCASLLQAQANSAADEVRAARADLDTASASLEKELQSARRAFDAMTPPASATPMQDRTGIPQWIVDLLGAGLGSLAVNGLGCSLIALGAHGMTREDHNRAVTQRDAPEISENAVTVEHEPVASRIIDVQPEPKPARTNNVVALRQPEPVASRDVVSAETCRPVLQFLTTHVPEAPDEETDLALCFGQFLHWLDTQNAAGANFPSVAPVEFRAVLDALVVRGYLKMRRRGKAIAIIGRRLAVA